MLTPRQKAMVDFIRLYPGATTAFLVKKGLDKGAHGTLAEAMYVGLIEHRIRPGGRPGGGWYTCEGEIARRLTTPQQNPLN